MKKGYFFVFSFFVMAFICCFASPNTAFAFSDGLTNEMKEIDKIIFKTIEVRYSDSFVA